MSTDELTTLFRKELDSDINDLEQWVDTANLPAINAFAHKYKVRLHYLGYSDSYELCLKIEKYFKDADNDTLMENAKKLYDRLLAIHQKGQ